MVRICDRLGEPPAQSLIYKDQLRSFQMAMLLVLTWAPDRPGATPEQLLNEILAGDPDHPFGRPDALEQTDDVGNMPAGYSADLVLAKRIVAGLKSEFFSKLYVERDERAEIQFMMQADRPILVHGPIGAGKSVILQKIAQDWPTQEFRDFAYIDFKAAPRNVFQDDNDGSGVDTIDTYISRILEDRYALQPEGIARRWRAYKVREDLAYDELKTKILDSGKAKVTDSRDHWAAVLERPEVRKQLFLLGGMRPSIGTLLRFLKEERQLVLCLDNVDNQSVRVQRDILSKAIAWSNEAQLPVVVAIRDSNLTRIHKEGMSGDIVLFDYVDAIVQGTSDDDVAIGALTGVTVKDLLEKRFLFLREIAGTETLRSFFCELSKTGAPNEEEYCERFWNVLAKIPESFFQENINQYSNYNIRSVLALCFNFVSSIVREAEKEYSLPQLLTDENRMQMTKLRTYYYKWLSMGGGRLLTAPSYMCRFLDPAGRDGRLHFLELRILEYLRNRTILQRPAGILFREVKQDFYRLGVSEERLRDCLLHLGNPSGLGTHAFVHLDIDESDRGLSDNSAIVLLPAGSYFLRSLSLSREYAFWCAIYADLELGEHYSRISYEAIYNDDFKLATVYAFANQVLIPAVRDELGWYSSHEHLRPPLDHVGGSRAYFDRLFSIGRRHYPCRLLLSVRNVIPHSNVATRESIARALRERITAAILRDREEGRPQPPSSVELTAIVNKELDSMGESERREREEELFRAVNRKGQQEWIQKYAEIARRAEEAAAQSRTASNGDLAGSSE